MKKNKIFSGKPYNPRGSVKRFYKKVMYKVMEHESLEDLTLEERRDLKAYIRSQRKEIREELTTSLAQQTVTGKRAIEEGFTETKLTDSATQLYNEWVAIKEFRKSIKVDYDALKEAENDKQFKDIVENDDKWTILRRLAVYDQRLNIDRSYASDVLREIENIIVQASQKTEGNIYYGMSYQEVADLLVGQYNKKNRYEFMNDWDEDMFEFDWDDDDSLFVNRKFHGRKRAEQDRDRYMKWHNKQLSSYDPYYQDPEEIMERLGIGGLYE